MSIPPDLIARLAALGGMLTGNVSKHGTLEVLTPRGCEWKYIWVIPEGLEAQIAEWEQQPRRMPRLTRTLSEWEQAVRTKDEGR
jgi:hypothetical protein